MEIKELLTKNRTYRRFHNEYIVTKEQLIELIEMTRLIPSAANLQPLSYKVFNDMKMNKKIYSTLKWAGYLKNWEGPIDSERPSAYIIILCNKDISKNCDIDVGIASQTILMKSTEMGLGGCMFGAINKTKLSEIIQINNAKNLKIKLVIALGKPKEKVKLINIDKNESIKYYRDKENIHYVPKRKLKDILDIE